jgi:hypothetical protein
MQAFRGQKALSALQPSHRKQARRRFDRPGAAAVAVANSMNYEGGRLLQVSGAVKHEHGQAYASQQRD